MLIQLSSFLHFCLLYLLLNSSDENDSEKSRLCMVMASKRRFYLALANVQGDVLSLSRMHVTRFLH